MKKKVLVFGTFDGIHEGHRNMLRQAKELGTHLIIVIASDDVVRQLKGSVTHHNTATRRAMLKEERIADEILVGDDEPESWTIIKRIKPDVVAVGYDQDELKSSLEEHFDEHYPDIEAEEGVFKKHPKKPTLVRLQPHEPETYKNSLLNND